MKSTIYRKGKELFRKGKVRLDVETDKALYLKVEGEHEEYSVRLMNDDTFNCTCRLGTLKAGKGALCSHVVAAILFAVSRATSSQMQQPDQP
jgi:uncharacterized Zn finger protein